MEVGRFFQWVNKQKMSKSQVQSKGRNSWVRICSFLFRECCVWTAISCFLWQWQSPSQYMVAKM